MSAPQWSAELELVDKALEAGDVPHALTHLGSALALAPNQEQVHARVEAIASKYPLLELLPKNEFLGAGVLEAFALRRVGRVDEAVVLLAQLAEAFPARRFETLLAAWLATAAAAKVVLKPGTLDQVMRLLMKVGESTIGLHRLLPGEKELLSGYEALADVALEGQVQEHLRFAASGLYRRLGRYEKALSAVAGQSGYFSIIQRGLAQRASGDAAAALASFQQSALLPEASTSDRLEQVRCHFIAGNFAAARELLAKVGEDSLEGDPELRGLQQLCEDSPKGDGVDVLDSLRRSLRGPIEQPADATANIFREHREKLPPGTARLKLAVSGWESPSNHLLVALFVSGTSELAQADYQLKDVVSFARDPAAQVRGAPPPTWKKLEAQVVHAVFNPPAAVLRTQLATVGSNSDFAAVWQRAGELAAKLQATPAELMTAMVHPPSEPQWLEQLPEALYRYQVGVACVLAQLPRPWSELRGYFESLLFGPIDWTSSAAVHALGETARRDPRAARDALELLSDATNDLLPHTAEPRAHALMLELGMLPAVSGEVRRRLSDWFTKQFPPEKPAVEAPNAPAEEETPAPAAAPVDLKPAVPGWVWLVGTLALAAALIALSLSLPGRGSG
jgi:tetratricopeptide (TPR) repeat protein